MSLNQWYRNPVFKQTYLEYLQQIANLELSEKAGTLGVRYLHGGLKIPLYNKNYQISAKGIFQEDSSQQELNHAETVVLCKYVLLCKKNPKQGVNWVSYRDFKNAAPFAGAFANNVEKAIAWNFTNQIKQLERACLALGGHVPDLKLSYDLLYCFKALPKVELLLLFNDKDTDFPAECSVLFRDNAAEYLDMECMAIIGWLLSDYLSQQTGRNKRTIM